MAVDIYGKGAEVKDKNPALTAALNEAYDKYLASEKVDRDQERGWTSTYTADQHELVQEAYTKAGLDPKTVPNTVDLGAWKNISTKYNGTSGDPQRMIELTVPYADGRTKDEAGARDAIAMGVANGWDDKQITQQKDQYNNDHSGKEGWFYENLGIKGSDLAKVAVIAAGGWALMPAAGAAATGAAAAGTAATTAASGLAGTMGMSAGWGATAVNAGALNAGITLARGGNIGDALKSGVTAAAFSGVGGWAKDLATPFVGSTLASVGSGAVTGALGSAVRGGDWKDGAINGAISGGISEASKAVGSFAKDNTIELGKGASDFAANAASAVTSTALRGGNLGKAGQNLAINFAGQAAGDFTRDSTGSDTAGILASNFIGNGGKLNVPSLINSLDTKKSVYSLAGVADPAARLYGGWAN